MQITLTNYTFEIPTDQHILVYANYRTGSTALCDLLSQRTGMTNLDEAFHLVNQYTDFSTELAKPCIIKIMPDQSIPDQYRSLIGKATAIGVYRRDLILQAISYALAMKTQLWHQQNGKLKQPPLFNFRPNELMIYADKLAHIHRVHRKRRDRMLIELQYEKLVPDLNESIYEEMPKAVEYHSYIANLRTALERENKRPHNE
jgi:LPS sulfotransferase NodH